MCNHDRDLKGINTSIALLASAQEASSKAIADLAVSNSEVAKTMGIMGEQLKTIHYRGCDEGDKRTRRAFDKLSEDIKEVDTDTNQRIDNQRIATGVVGALAILGAGFITWLKGN